jgi:peptide/nickel transport system ATP-binding protein
MTEPLLSVTGLRVHLPSDRGLVRAIDGIDFSLERGEALGLVGESGSGKTMTALSIMRLLPPTARVLGGQIWFEGEDLLTLTEPEMGKVRGSQIGMTFQDPSTFLNPVMKIGEQVAEAVRQPGSPASIRQRVAEVLDMVRLPRSRDVAQLYPHELSGGMRQRVLLAIALAANPKLIIADEPTTALDVTIQAQVLDLIRGLQAELGVALILVSHDLGVIAEICSRVCVMYAGEIVEAAAVDELYENPQHPYSQGLLRSTISVHEKRRILTAMDGAVPDLTAPPDGCRFHPRCPRALQRCLVDAPPAIPVGADDRSAARCWLHDPSTVASSPPLEAVAANPGPPGQPRAAGASAAYGLPASLPVEQDQRDPLLRLEGVRKYFHRRSGVLFGKTEITRAVEGINLEIAEGETLALVGESGSGKSTLGRLVLRLIELDQGEIHYRDVDVARANRQQLFNLRREIQMVFQDPFSSLNPRKTVYGTIAQPLELHHVVEKARIPGRVAELLTSVGLVPPSLYADRYPHELSGGQRQRVALARALAPLPKFVVADEPVASLDVSVRAQVLNLMREAREGFKITYLFITHDLGVVRSIADRVAVMYLGQLVEVGPTESIIQSPRHPYTRALLDSTPIANPKLARQRARVTISGEIPSASHPPPGCRFHPRCPVALPICTSLEPSLLPIDAEWSAACHLVHPPEASQSRVPLNTA